MKNLLYGIIGVLTIASTAIGGYFGWNNDQESSYEIGDKVETFSLKNLDNNTSSLADLTGSSGTIIIFTCNTCPYSKLYEDRIFQIVDIYQDAGYPVVLINPSDPDLKPGDQPSELLKWTQEKGYSGAYLIDGIGLYHRFAVEKTPEVFLLDREMILRYRGAIDDSAQGVQNVTVKFLENAITALENNEDPDPSVTHPVGCVIKND